MLSDVRNNDSAARSQIRGSKCFETAHWACLRHLLPTFCLEQCSQTFNLSHLTESSTRCRDARNIDTSLLNVLSRLYIIITTCWFWASYNKIRAPSGLCPTASYRSILSYHALILFLTFTVQNSHATTIGPIDSSNRLTSTHSILFNRPVNPLHPRVIDNPSHGTSSDGQIIIPPPAFFLVVVAVVLLALLLLLTFWCVHKRTSRRKAQRVDQHQKPATVVQEQPKNSITSIVSVSLDHVQQPPLAAREDPQSRNDDFGNVSKHWVPQCLACCPTSLGKATATPQHTQKLNDINKKTESPTVSDSLEATNTSSSNRRSPLRLCLKSNTTDSSEASSSPSLASRRHVAPLPKLMTAAVLSPPPPIETCVFAVQTKESFVPQAAKPLSVDSAIPPAANRRYTPHHSLSQPSESVPMRASPCSSRQRTKGLLESRRGSHTSLTLSLSPFPATAPETTNYYSAGLPSNLRGVSLDDNSGLDPRAHFELGSEPGTRLLSVCTPEGHCDSARTTFSEGHDHFTTQSPLVIEANTSNETSQAGPQLKLSVSDSNRGELPTVRHVHHGCDHQMLYRRLHCHPTHHRCIETGQPCPHMALSYQRSRDLEQLRNASQPLTYEQLCHKLQENASALFQEFWNIPMNHTSKKELPIAGIGQKNRYQSILPNYSSRVVLPMIANDPLTSYINANYIRGYGDRPNAFIATQGPMSHTVVDFWRMVWHCNAPAIVMITRLVEKQGVKCELYLPNTPASDPAVSMLQRTDAQGSVTDSPSSHGSQSVSCPSHPVRSPTEDSGIASREDQSVSGKLVVDQSSGTKAAGPDSLDSVALPSCAQMFGDIYVTVVDIERFEGYSVRQLLLKRNSEERVVFHFWYTAWPDHSSPETTPGSSRQLLNLVRAVESCRPQKRSDHSTQSAEGTKDSVKKGQLPQPAPPAGDGPIVVHCSAGLGRTGCFIALCIGCDQLEHEGVVDVLRIVSRLRLDRGGMVQTNEQYEFIHHALTAFPSLQHSSTGDLR